MGKERKNSTGDKRGGEKMIDLSERILHELKTEAHKARVPYTKVIQVFMESYEIHKRIHGSYKHIPDYRAKMNERYSWMKQRALDFIANEENKQHLGVGSKI